MAAKVPEHGLGTGPVRPEVNMSQVSQDSPEKKCELSGAPKSQKMAFAMPRQERE